MKVCVKRVLLLLMLTWLHLQVALHRCYSIMPVVEGENIVDKHLELCTVLWALAEIEIHNSCLHKCPE